MTNPIREAFKSELLAALAKINMIGGHVNGRIMAEIEIMSAIDTYTTTLLDEIAGTVKTMADENESDDMLRIVDLLRSYIIKSNEV